MRFCLSARKIGVSCLTAVVQLVFCSGYGRMFFAPARPDAPTNMAV